MGALGAILATRLDYEGLDFTWEDAHRPVQAWRASTGAVYPSGDAAANADLAEWQAWHDGGVFPGRTEAGVPWTNLKAPPHGAKARLLEEQGPLRCFTGLRTLHVDVPGLVEEARLRYAGQCRSQPEGSRLIVAHGFHQPAMTHVLWGWSAVARIGHDLPGDTRPCFLLHEHRFNAPYAYPRPGRPEEWLVGSQMVRQRVPASRDIEGPVLTWLQTFNTLCDAQAMVIEVKDFKEGWRPCRPTSPDPAIDVGFGGTILLPPMSHSGIRRAPSIVKQVVQELTQ